MSDVTGILSAIERGDPHAAQQLLPLVYDELRRLAAQKLAQEKPGAIARKLEASGHVTYDNGNIVASVNAPRAWRTP